MRILGIDYGDRRTGVAISDPFGWTAQGLEAVIGDMEKTIERISDIASSYQVESIIVGYPLNMNGTVGFRAEKTEIFINKLSQKTKLSVIKWDERLTSVYAGNTLKEVGVKASKNKAKVDILSAVILLQSYLDNSLRKK